MLKPGLQLYLNSILIEHKQEFLKSLRWTATAPHFICMFILPVRGPLFMDNWRTQIIIPLEWKICSYYLQRFAMPLCTLALPSDCLFIITAFLLSQWGSIQVQKGAKPFPIRDIIVYTPKTHWSVSCLQPGWHTSHATKVKHKVHMFWLCPLDLNQKTLLGPGYSHNVGPRRHSTWLVCPSLWWNAELFAFAVEICNLPT